jgi:hypothetical protein
MHLRSQCTCLPERPSRVSTSSSLASHELALLCPGPCGGGRSTMKSCLQMSRRPISCGCQSRMRFWFRGHPCLRDTVSVPNPVYVTEPLERHHNINGQMDMLSRPTFHLRKAFDEVKLAFQPVRSDEIIDDGDVAFHKCFDNRALIFQISVAIDTP